MQALPVIEHLDLLNNGPSSFGVIKELSMSHQLVLQ
jgi:hypothetical protein